MLDAEHTFIQASIDTIILALQKKFNLEDAVVYNTYQCYRKVYRKCIYTVYLFHSSNAIHLFYKLKELIRDSTHDFLNASFRIHLQEFKVILNLLKNMALRLLVS